MLSIILLINYSNFDRICLFFISTFLTRVRMICIGIRLLNEFLFLFRIDISIPSTCTIFTRGVIVFIH